ncbi:alpha/beta fold hydrolase [Cumulibacter soli]|uniref:alpha/beta fold hydrolase n=1 Tax=Cumulibacter soli TaxID=2546344 RepID=UPI0010672B3B|nr:alpha/beta fold hydrolase [Cumulibacter soli]
MDALSYQVLGDPDRPTVALLHGMLSSSAQWAPNVEVLSKHFQLVMVEVWGHGDSPVPSREEAFDVDAMVDALDEVRRAVGVPRWSLIGYSYGGALALQYAVRRAQHTNAVVFTNSRASMAIPDAAECARNAANILQPGAIGRLPFHPKNASRLPRELHDSLIQAADGTAAEAVSGLMRTVWQLSMRERLDELTVPVTLINGRFERSFQPAAREIRQRAPHIAVHDVDAGHAVNMQAVDDFNAIVIRTLQ